MKDKDEKGPKKGDEEERRAKKDAEDGGKGTVEVLSTAGAASPAEAKRIEKLRQSYLPGQEPPPEIEELNEAFENHLTNRKRFQSASNAVNETKEILKMLMKKHKRPFYRFEGHDAILQTSEDFTIAKVKEEKKEGE